MSVRHLDKIFAARSIALIGATPRPGSVGALALRNLRRANFRGELMLVNPHHTEIEGQQIYPSVAHLPTAPDLAVIVTPPESVPGLIEELGTRGTRGAVVVTAGFAEIGERGRVLQQRLLDASKPHLLRIIGPNCLGIMVPKIGLDASFSHLAPAAGQVALVSQSGAMVTAMLDWAAPRNIGFSHVVSLGDMADVDFGDMLDYLAGDTETRAILLYVEALTHGRKFMSAARAAARLKPVLVLKAGRSSAGARAASSHTGALAGTDGVYDAVFRRAGMLRVDTMAELFAAAETLALTREQSGSRLAVLTNGGGAGVLAADALAAAGGELAALEPETISRLDHLLPPTWSHGNPVDIIGDATGPRYAAALSVLLSDRTTDAVLVLNCPTALASSVDAAEAVVAAAKTEHSNARNIYTAWLGEQSAHDARRRFADAGIASYETPDEAVTAFMQRVRYRENRSLLMQTPPARPKEQPVDTACVRSIISAVLEAKETWLPPEAATQVIAAYGIPVALVGNAARVSEVARIAAEVGFPCALKIRSPDITHKSDVGGVALDLANAEMATRAATAMLQSIKHAVPNARIDGFLLQPMVRKAQAIELLIGLSNDPVFGPVVVFGQGGTAVEIVNDVSLEFPPLNTLLARSLIARTRVSKLLQGYRGKMPANIDAIVDVIIRVGQLAIDHPEIRELDINPLLADAAGVIALDARIRVAPFADAPRPAIAPYPEDLASVEHTRDGDPVTVRPLLPEDEPRLHELAAAMRPEDLRLRFFSHQRGLTHAVAARLSQLDYDREMGLIAERDGAALGAGHFFADPDNQRAEFAVAVRSDCKGHGIGYLLMQRLIAIAEQRGIGFLEGEVLRENRPMLEMCRDLGFIGGPRLDDPAVVSVQKMLGSHPTAC